MTRKKNTPRGKRTTHRFVLTVAAPSQAAMKDVQAAVELVLGAGLADLAESLRMPKEEQWDTELAAALEDIELSPLKEAP